MGARAEINAVVDLVDAPHVHMVISAMPRGGFSGGPVWSEQGFALGLVTRSLITGSDQLELGFMTMLSVEPIHQCLADARLLPDGQAEGWDDFWNTETILLSPPDLPHVVAAVLEVFDDGRRVYVTVDCRGDSTLLADCVDAVSRGLAGAIQTSEEATGRIRLSPNGAESREDRERWVQKTVVAAMGHLKAAGLAVT